MVVRLGIAIAQPPLIQILSNTKAPYNISTPTANLALSALETPALDLMRQGFVAKTPQSPEIAVSVKTLQLLYWLRRRKPSFSIEAFAKVVCDFYTVRLHIQYSRPCNGTDDCSFSVTLPTVPPRRICRYVRTVRPRDSRSRSTRVCEIEVGRSGLAS